MTLDSRRREVQLMPIEIIELSGSPGEMGRQHAEQAREAGTAIVRARCDLALSKARERDESVDMSRCLSLAAEHLPAHERYSPEVYAEFRALAEGLGVGEDELLIGNGYTDYIDVLMLSLDEGGGCTSFIATGEATADGLTYVGQTWDMNAFAEPHMRLFRRQPDDGPAWLTLTAAGCLSLIGLSGNGIAIGNTNVAPNDARPGVMYLAMIHEALRSADFDNARAAITDAPRASGHYYYLAGADGCAVGLETTARRHVELPMERGLLVHANHYHGPDLAELSRQPASENSQAREIALHGYLWPRAGRIELEDLVAGLRLHQGAHPVCRPPAEASEVTTCAAAIICPQRRTMWVAIANPATVEFEEITI